MNNQSSFMRGVYRAFDFNATNKDTLNVLTKLTYDEAIMKDWKNVGKSINTAARRFDSRGTTR